MDTTTINIKVRELIELFEWSEDDDVQIEVGGTVVSGIHQPPEANAKWSTPFGVRKYNKDAFIVIKNKSRNPTISSKPDETLIPHHLSRDTDGTDDGSGGTGQ